MLHNIFCSISCKHNTVKHKCHTIFNNKTYKGFIQQRLSTYLRLYNILGALHPLRRDLEYITWSDYLNDLLSSRENTIHTKFTLVFIIPFYIFNFHLLFFHFFECLNQYKQFNLLGKYLRKIFVMMYTKRYNSIRFFQNWFFLGVKYLSI